MQDDHSFSNESGRAARKLTTIAKVIVMYIGRPLVSDRSGRSARRTTTIANVVVLRAGLPLLGQIWPFTGGGPVGALSFLAPHSIYSTTEATRDPGPG